MRTPCISIFALTLGLAASATAQIVVPGADGSDGPFSPAVNTTIDLSLAANATWDAPSPIAGRGVYDGGKWAVVFKYTSVNIPAGVTVTFTNHLARAPVVWLVSGNVTITGTVNLDGKVGTSNSIMPEAGPGGFRGGRGHLGSSSPGSAGLGPGGGRFKYLTTPGGHASYATVGGPGGTGIPGAVYGNESIMPLIGGSGGSAYTLGTYSGSSGGGAILVACTETLALNGSIVARGTGSTPSWDSSGGAIRLIANQISGTGALLAHNLSNPGGVGRIRVEGNSISLGQPSNPTRSEALAGPSAVLWPAPTAPTIKGTLLGGQTIPSDPRASFSLPSADVTLANPNPVVIQLECTNIPTTGSTVTVRVVPISGEDSIFNATFISGDTNISIWEATLTIPDGFTAIQAHAVLP